METLEQITLEKIEKDMDILISMYEECESLFESGLMSEPDFIENGKSFNKKMNLLKKLHTIYYRFENDIL